MKNCKIFRYRGKKYIVSEMEVAKDWFKGVGFKKNGITHCIIQSALSGAEKQRELHRLITL